MIAVIGSSNMDIVFNVDHFTLPGETQKALSLDFYYGGKGANQAVAVAKLSEEPVCFCSCLGNDDYGKEISKNFQNYKIEGYIVEKNEKTGRAYIEVDKSGENRIILFPGANEKVDKLRVDKFLNQYGKNIEICLLQNEIPMESVEYAVSRLKKENITIVYDPAPVGGTEIEIIDGIDFLTPNEKEFKFLCEKTKIPFDENDPKQSMSTFKDLSKVKNLILKMGDKGVYYLDEQNNFGNIRKLKVNAIDTTGAGDVFNGAFAVAFGKSKDLLKSLNFANVAAALSVTKKGAQSSIPKKEQVLSHFQITS
ncbi:ribokinase [Petrotoga sp. 9PW.55.5.1]|uniref:ribokinase n=1 Tax=Petrotoga sp. 9PW.55.5.1 TaxID=1308979 RepID=UPI000DD65161|nr:ribokinase [Petrotoga sp. 9PW.55.5.1]